MANAAHIKNVPGRKTYVRKADVLKTDANTAPKLSDLLLRTKTVRSAALLALAHLHSWV